jgi:hypothetical protein
LFETRIRKRAELAETAANCYSNARSIQQESFSACKRAVTPRCGACGRCSLRASSFRCWCSAMRRG